MQVTIKQYLPVSTRAGPGGPEGSATRLYEGVEMSSWYTDYLLARGIAEDRWAEAERDRLARSLGGHDHDVAVRPAPARGRERPPLRAAATAARVRCWTVRLARLVVTVSVEPAAGPEVGS